MAKLNEMDYLFVTGRIRVLEQDLLSSEKIDRMLEADDLSEAAKVLTECGYPEMSEVNVDTVNETLAKHRDEIYSDFYLFAPDRRIIDVFRVKYDYHNAKVLLKAEARNINEDRLLVKTGLVDPEKLKEAVRSGDYYGMTGRLPEAVPKAREVLGATKDPQLSDFVLDAAYFKDMEDMACGVGSEFLKDYVALLVDSANLKSLVRTLRMGKDSEFLKGVLFDGGKVEAKKIISAAESGNNVTGVFSGTALEEAAQEGGKVLSKGSLTEFEKLCDNAQVRFIKKAKFVTFGEAPLVAYLAASENDLTAVRIIMTGRLAHLDTDIIRERLRETYV